MAFVDEPPHFEIDSVAGIVAIRETVPDNVRELGRAIAAAVADPHYRRGFGFLRDRRGAPAPYTQYIDEVVELLDRTAAIAGSRWAVVVSDPANLGMVRMAAIKAQTVEIQVFDDLEAARYWLVSSQAMERRE